MQTVQIELTNEWQQVADASGVVTMQVRGGFCKLYVGDAAPSGDVPEYSVQDEITLGSTAKAWVRGAGAVVAITV